MLVFAVTYSRDSLIMATFMLILTTILRKLILCRMDSPKWIGTATGYAMNSRAVQLVFMFDGSLKVKQYFLIISCPNIT